MCRLRLDWMYFGTSNNIKFFHSCTWMPSGSRGYPYGRISWKILCISERLPFRENGIRVVVQTYFQSESEKWSWSDDYSMSFDSVLNSLHWYRALARHAIHSPCLQSFQLHQNQNAFIIPSERISMNFFSCAKRFWARSCVSLLFSWMTISPFCSTLWLSKLCIYLPNDPQSDCILASCECSIVQLVFSSHSKGAGIEFWARKYPTNIDWARFIRKQKRILFAFKKLKIPYWQFVLSVIIICWRWPLSWFMRILWKTVRFFG